MREIKFRAGYKGRMWDVWRLEWHKGSLVAANLRRDDYGYNEYWFASGSEELALYQSTGLKDKNDKEIYEGDILLSKGLSLPMKVEWDRRTASFCATPVRGGFVAFSMKGVYSEKEHSIIGNVYENPELLDAKTDETN